jgi:hypothetical protein
MPYTTHHLPYFQPVREISKWLRAHPKNSAQKTPKRKGDDAAAGAVPQKNPAQKLAELAAALTASADDKPRIRSKSSPNLTAMDSTAAKPLQTVREGFQTVLIVPPSKMQHQRTPLTFG